MDDPVLDQAAALESLTEPIDEVLRVQGQGDFDQIRQRLDRFALTKVIPPERPV